jgi:hypothetical protein
MDKFMATCLITGKTENLHMHATRNDKGEMVGWFFVHESINMDEYETIADWRHVAKPADSEK